MSQQSDGLRLRGQSEPLTRRLKRLLDEYSDGLAVPKELLQNADDAGATEVTLVYDCRENASWRRAKFLLDPAMAESQGRALWAHNNATFSDSDFDNILELSGATKLQQAAKVGRFGLGFNSVYNLTDVPVILSRHRLLVLDPHGERRDEGYLEAVYASRGARDTGVELDFRAQPAILDRYADQLAPFHGVAGCDLRASGGDFNGTLFRLPLRTEAQATKSKVCGRVYTDAEMRALLRLAAEQADTLLLFTQTVRTLRCLHLTSNAANPSADGQLVFTVQKNPMAYFQRHSLPVPHLPLDGMSQADQEFAAQSATLKVAEVLLGEVAASRTAESAKRRETRTQMTVMVQLQVGEHARREFKLKVATATRVWLVCAAVGTGESLAMAREQQRLGLAPVGAVALLLDQSQLVPLSRDSQPASLLFCFLPLPVENPFPVMLNASFSVTSSRRHLNEVTVDEKQGVWSLGEWNRALLRDVICPAYVDALRLLTGMQLTNAEASQRLWPRLETATQAVWRPLIEKFYASVLDSQEPVFHTSAGWKSLSASVFLDPTIQSLHSMSDCLTRLAKRLVSQQEGLATLTDGVWKTLVELQLANRILQRQWSGEKLLLNFVSNMARLWPSAEHEDCFKALLFILDVKSRGGNFDWESMSRIVTPMVLDSIRWCSCIPNSSDVLCQPSQLLDPGCLAGRLYGTNEPVFPHLQLRSKTRLTTLRSLGLRVDLTWPEVLERARSIETLTGPQRLERTEVLLTYLDSCNGRISHPFAQLATIRFLPAMHKPASCNLAWLSDSYPATQLFQPNQLFGSRFRDLVSATQLVLDDKTVLSQNLVTQREALQSVIGVQTSVPIQSVWTQLAIVVEYGVATNETKQVSLFVYKHLSLLLDKRQLSALDVQRFRSQQAARGIIWSSGGFLQPAQVSESRQQQEFPPYLHFLPLELNSHQYLPFLRAAGIVNAFTAQHYALVLQQLHQRYSTRALTPGDREMCIRLLKVVVECSTETPGLRVDNIFAPDQSGVLRPRKQLCFNNLPWLDSRQLASETYYCHKDVSYGLCERLGIPSQSDSTLQQSFLAGGQHEHEKLTTRLQNIISGYPLGSELFKELIQNADDAGASKIWFINDRRCHGTEKVFSDNWRELQGPALLVYNDSVFSEADINGIQSLGLGSKRDEAWKTGQYGIGFNCVYNVTDAPSFLSDDNVLCVMDPHCIYMPNASQASPGGMVKNLTEIRAIFSEVFAAYLPEQLQHRGSTVFRLPLRTQAAAVRSEICKAAVTSSNIDALFQDIKCELSRTMLFLTSVREIRLCEVTPNGAFSTVVSVTSCANDVAGSFENYKSKCREASKQLVQPGARFDCLPVSSVMYKLRTVSSETGAKRQTEEWLIGQKLGGPAVPPPQLQQQIATGEWRLLPKVGVATAISAPKGKISGGVYCLLPLPLTTSLPVHLNGHFLLDPSRRALWQAAVAEDCKSQWNSLLATQLLPDCYGSLLKAATTLFTSAKSVVNYYRLFPVINCYELSLWNELAKALFLGTFKGRWPIFPVYRAQEQTVEWLPLAQTDDDVNGSAGFLTPPNVDNFLRKLLNDLQYPLIVLDSVCLLQSFTACNLQYLPVASSQSIAAFLRGSVCASLRASLPLDVSETPFCNAESVVQLLVYLCRELGDNLQVLCGTPLNLTAGNRLTVLGQSAPLFLTEFSDLFSHSEVRHEFANSEVFKAFSEPQSQSRLTQLSQLFATFQLSQFAKLLRRVHPSVFGRDKIFVSEEEFGMNSAKLHGWLEKVWYFLHNQVSSLKRPLEQLNSAGLCDCHLIPVERSRLFRLDLVPCVYETSGRDIDDLSKRVQDGLRALNAPARTLKRLWLVGNLCGNVRRAESMLRVMEFALNENPERSAGTEHQACDFLLYIQNNWQQLSDSQGEKQLLDRIRRLPAFVTSDGRTCALNSAQACILPASLLADEMNKWKSVSQAIFLKGNHALTPLYSKLQCDRMEESEVYARFILPAFSHLSAGTRWRHLERLRELSWKFDAIRHSNATVFDALQAALRAAELVPVQGGWKLAGAFYDNKVELFKCVLGAESFLPSPYDTEEWHRLMQSAGLITICSAAIAITIAQKLASDGLSRPFKEVQKRSTKLLQFIAGPEFKERTEAVIEQLVKIAFIVSHHDAHLGELCACGPVRMVSLNQCSAYVNRCLCWTLTPYAPDCVKHNGCFANFLQPVTDVTFLLHLANLFASETFKSANLQGSIAELRINVMHAVYARLAKMTSLNSAAAVLSSLKNLPCVLIFLQQESFFVAPNRVTHDEASAVPPFIFACSGQFDTHMPLFIHLGATESASTEQMRLALELIQQGQKDSLDANQQSAVTHCVSNIVALLEEGKHINFPPSVKLFLPTKKKDANLEQQRNYILVDCRELVISDVGEAFQKRLIDSHGARLLDLEFCKLGTDKLRRLYFHLDNELNLQKLSSLAAEKLLSDPSALCAEGEICPIRCHLDAKLKHPMLHQCITSILLHDSTDLTVSGDNKLAAVTSLLSSFSIVCLSELRTCLFINGEQQRESDEEKHFFLDGTRILMNHSSIPDPGGDQYELWRMDFIGVVLTILQHTARFTARQESLLTTVLLVDQPESMMRVLEKAKISAYEAGEQTSNRPNLTDPSLGTTVTEMEQCRLKQLPASARDLLNHVVAYRTPDGKLVYAKVLEQHGRDSNLWTSEFTIDTGGAHTRVSAAMLFAFEQGVAALNAPASSREDLRATLDSLLSSASELSTDQQCQALQRVLAHYSDSDETYAEARNHAAKHRWTRKFNNRINSWHEDVVEVIRYRRIYYAEEIVFAYRTQRSSGGSGSYYSGYRGSSRGFTSGRSAGAFTGWSGASAASGCVSGQADRYLRTARDDLRAATCLAGAGENNWACYLCWQAAEKALKAAIMMQGESAERSHRLSQHLCCIVGVELQRQLGGQVANLSAALIDDCRYPSDRSSPRVPSAVFGPAEATLALQSAEGVLACVESIVSG